MNVYSSMLRQVLRDYPGVGDFRRLSLEEIRWLYDGLRPELVKATSPSPRKK